MNVINKFKNGNFFTRISICLAMFLVFLLVLTGMYFGGRYLLNASVQFHNFLEYDCEVYKERIANANGNQEELKRVILEIFDRVPIKNFDEVNIKKELGDMMHDYFSTDTDVVSEDKHI